VIQTGIIRRGTGFLFVMTTLRWCANRGLFHHDWLSGMHGYQRHHARGAEQDIGHESGNEE